MTAATSSDHAATAGWGVVLPVGPSPLEVERLVDTLDSLHSYEPQVTAVVLVDDQPEAERDLMATAGPLRDRTTVVVNPRSPDLEGWSDGLVIAVATGLDTLRADPNIVWTLKMDTGALVIGPFADVITDRFAADPKLGLVGVHTHQPDGAVRDVSRATHHLEKLYAPLTLWRPPAGPIRTSLVGRGRRRRQLLSAARRHGYRFGEHCQGGPTRCRWPPSMPSPGTDGWMPHSGPERAPPRMS